MPRSHRLIVPGFPHHITQRGNGGQAVFLSDAQRTLFLRLLSEQCCKHGIVILGYCLMTNHYHAVIVPPSPDSTARAFARVHGDFARRMNAERQTSGRFWQGRYFIAAMDPLHCWNAVAYAERNPVRAGLVKLAEFYPWSSAAARLGLAKCPDWLDLAAWRRGWSGSDWQGTLRDCDAEPEFATQLRAATFTGLPYGDEALARTRSRRTAAAA